MNWTDEQIAFSDAVVAGKSCKLAAYAGTGKSSALLLAAQRDGRPGVCLVFNRAIAIEGQRRFAASAPCVSVSTGHSFAMRAVGRFYNHRVQKSTWQFRNALSERYLREFLKVSQSPGDADRMIFAVMDVIRSFEQSIEPEITAAHLPVEAMASRVVSLFGPEILRVARLVWADIEDRAGTLCVSHDAYFKLWALTNPRIDADVIYADEYQDFSALMVEVLRQQTHAQKVLCGDSYQAIYAWRGAKDAMESCPFDEYPLTMSWRFGPEIASIANMVLKARRARWPLVGGAPNGKVSLRGEAPATCILSRTNAGMVDVALSQLLAGRKVAFLGGVEAVASTMEGAYDLWLNGKSEHPNFRLFRSWTELDEVSRTTHGGTLRAAVRLVDRFTYGVPELVTRLRAETVSEAEADVVLSTVHGFKGRGSQVLRLSGDFLPFATRVVSPPSTFPEPTIHSEEANIAYVALTRAEHELQIGAYYETFKKSLDVAAEVIAASERVAVAPQTSDEVKAVPARATA